MELYLEGVIGGPQTLPVRELPYFFFLSGYSEVRISQFEAVAAQEGLTPICYILSDWSKQSHLANISTLARTLHMIGREDVSRAILPTNYNKEQHRALPGQPNQVPRIENMYQTTGAAYYSARDEQRL